MTLKSSLKPYSLQKLTKMTINQMILKIVLMNQFPPFFNYLKIGLEELSNSLWMKLKRKISWFRKHLKWLLKYSEIVEDLTTLRQRYADLSRKYRWFWRKINWSYLLPVSNHQIRQFSWKRREEFLICSWVSKTTLESLDSMTVRKRPLLSTTPSLQIW